MIITTLTVEQNKNAANLYLVGWSNADGDILRVSVEPAEPVDTDTENVEFCKSLLKWAALNLGGSYANGERDLTLKFEENSGTFKGWE